MPALQQERSFLVNDSFLVISPLWLVDYGCSDDNVILITEEYGSEVIQISRVALNILLLKCVLLGKHTFCQLLQNFDFMYTCHSCPFYTGMSQAKYEASQKSLSAAVTNVIIDGGICNSNFLRHQVNSM